MPDPFINQTPTTWDQAKSEVAKIVGHDGVTSWLDRAGTAIRRAMHKWENFRDWYWLRAYEEIALSDNTSVYTLNAAHKKPVSARIGTQKLTWMPAHLWDALNPGNTGTAYTYYTMYNLFSSGSETAAGKIQILPGIGDIDSGTLLKLRYIRRLNDTIGTTTARLDFPEQYETGLLSHAKWFLLLDKGGDEDRRREFRAIGDTEMFTAQADELRNPDAEIGQVPWTATASQGWNPNSLDLAIGY
jgi:hypothetical protein